MSEWKPKPYQPHQSWAGQGPKTALVVNDPQYDKYPPGKGPYPGNLSKSAWDAKNRAEGRDVMGRKNAFGRNPRQAKTIPEKKVGQFQTKSKQTLLTQQKKGEVPKTKGDWKTVLRNQTSASKREIAAGKLGTKLKTLITNLKGRPRGR